MVVVVAVVAVVVIAIIVVLFHAFSVDSEFECACFFPRPRDYFSQFFTRIERDKKHERAWP